MGRKDRVKTRTSKSVRKRFHGNRFTKKSTEEKQQQHDEESVSTPVDNVVSNSHAVHDSIRQTVSEAKVVDIVTNTPKQSDIKITGYRLIDVEILSELMGVLCCPECKTCGLKLHENFAAKKGFASNLQLKCECGFQKQFYTSKTCKQKRL